MSKFSTWECWLETRIKHSINPRMIFLNISEISFSFHSPHSCFTDRTRPSTPVLGDSAWLCPWSELEVGMAQRGPGAFLCNQHASSRALHVPASRGAGVVFGGVGVGLYWPRWTTGTDDTSQGRGSWRTAPVYGPTCQVQVCYLEMKQGR